MAKELEKMREIRIQQKNIRISLQKREERNKELREKITPIWADPCKEYEVYQLNKELFKGREKVRGYQKTLREFKVNLRETNRSYDLNANGKTSRGKDMVNSTILEAKDLEQAEENLIGIAHEVQGIVRKARG